MRPSFPGSEYVVALLVTALALAVRWLLDRWLGDSLALVTLFGAAALVVWFGGWRPAVATAALGYLGCHALFIEPRGAFAWSAEIGLGLIAYAVSIGTIIGFGEAVTRARERASDGRELLRVTLRSIGDAVITTDLAGRIVSMNPVACELTGWTEADARGIPLERVFRIVNEGTRQPVASPAARALREGAIVGLANHTILIAKDGRERPIDDSAAPIRDAHRAVAGCVLVFRDVTQRRAAERALEESERELVDTFENASVGMHRVDADGVILWANRAELEMLGYAYEEFVGRNIAEFHVDAGAIENIFARLRRGETLLEEPAQMRAKDGSIRDVLVNSNGFFEDGRFVHSRCFVTDVTERKLEEQARARLAAIVTDSDDAIISKTLEGVIRSWNVGAERVFGYTASEAIGRSINVLIPADLQEEERSILARLQRGERIDHFETVRIAKGGRRVDISLTVSPIHDDSGRVVGASKVARDVTDRKRAETALRESEERFRLMADAAPVLIWVSDTDKRHTWFNRQWLELVGRPLAAQVGTGWTQSVHPDDREHCLRRFSEAFDARRPFVMEYRLRSADGSYRWMLDNGVPRSAAGRFSGYIGSCVDITDRKHAEMALEQADRRKDEFLATLAHELRNPLAPIRNAVQILLFKESDDPELRWSRDVIDRQVQQMARLLDDLLDVSRISHNKLELRRELTNLSAVVQSAVETSRPLIDAGSHALTVSLPREPVHVDADPVRLAQVFSNLLNNAAKYTERGGHLRIDAHRAGDHVVVSVKDDGIGISADTLPRIFDMFSQERGVLERSQGGLGIGLALVRGLVELHGGTVIAKSAGLDRGSEFVVSLPSFVPPVVRTPSHDSETALGRRHRILVVDDGRDSADSLALLLAMKGHDVRTAYDGEQALEAARDDAPDVVLLDLGMPKLNGYEVCRVIRDEPWGKDMIVIALTGWGQEADRRDTEEAGFDHHLVKPVDPDTLGEVLDSLAAQRELS